MSSLLKLRISPTNVNPTFEDMKTRTKTRVVVRIYTKTARQRASLGGLGVCLRGCKNRTIPHVRRDPDRRGQPFGQDGVQIDAGGRKQPYLRPCLFR